MKDKGGKKIKDIPTHNMYASMEYFYTLYSPLSQGNHTLHPHCTFSQKEAFSLSHKL